VTDIVLEVVRACILLGIVVFLWKAGRDRFELARRGWNFIISGFCLLLFGSILDVTDNFESLNQYVVIGDTEAEAILEKFIGFLGGFIFLAVGLFQWIPKVQSLSDLVDERTKGLQDANDSLTAENTKRNRAEVALRDSEARSRAIVDNIVDGVIIIDEKGCIQSFNPAVGRIFGCRKDDVLGKPVDTLLAEPYSHPFEAFGSDDRKGGKTNPGVSRLEIEGLRRSGEVFPMEIALNSVHLGDERLFVGIVRDITDRKEVDRIKAEFISTVSHELRTPLTSIHGSLGLVAGGVASGISGRAKEMVELAQRNTERLIKLVNDILDMEKIEAGNMEFRHEAVDIASLVEEVIEDNRGFAEEHRVRFLLNKTPQGLKVWGDGDRLAQVLANLLSNSAKFSPVGGTVDIAVAQIEDGARIAVSDHGPGIPEEFHSQVFDKFTQANSSDARENGGTGLGLSISKAIVDRHGGDIWFDSTIGVGTTFYVELRHDGLPPPTIPPLQ
jgi:PAS domain S-box-containing protein